MTGCSRLFEHPQRPTEQRSMGCRVRVTDERHFPNVSLSPFEKYLHFLEANRLFELKAAIRNHFYFLLHRDARRKIRNSIFGNFSSFISFQPSFLGDRKNNFTSTHVLFSSVEKRFFRLELPFFSLASLIRDYFCL